MKKKYNVRSIVLVGVISALVFVTSAIRIPIPTAVGNTAIHLGNIFCLLSGMLMGGVKGGVSSGLGSMLYDFTNPAYIAESPITFINKFAMGFVCGMISKRSTNSKSSFKLNILGGLAGSLTYVVLYVGKTFITNFFLMGAPIQTVLVTCGQKGLVSIINGVIAVVFAVILAPIFEKAMNASKF